MLMIGFCPPLKVFENVFSNSILVLYVKKQGFKKRFLNIQLNIQVSKTRLFLQKSSFVLKCILSNQYIIPLIFSDIKKAPFQELLSTITNHTNYYYPSAYLIQIPA